MKIDIRTNKEEYIQVIIRIEPSGGKHLNIGPVTDTDARAWLKKHKLYNLNGVDRVLGSWVPKSGFNFISYTNGENKDHTWIIGLVVVELVQPIEFFSICGPRGGKP